MSNKVYIVTSNLSNHVKIEGVFSCYEYVEKFKELENSKLEEFRKQDEGYTIESYKVDCMKVPDARVIKNTGIIWST